MLAAAAHPPMTLDVTTLFIVATCITALLGLLLLSVILVRRIYAVFGTLGIAGYLGYLAHTVFIVSMLFPFALSLIGVAIIAAGLLYHKKQAVLAAWIESHMPAALARLRPAHAR